MKTWNGSSWTLRSGDLKFAVLGSKETTLQVRRMVAAGGQFLRGVRALDTSGVQHLLWRPLQRTCKEEVEELLAVGTSAPSEENPSGCSAGRKLDAIVDARRNVVVWERKDDAAWRMDGEAPQWENPRGAAQELWTLVGSEWNAGMDWLGGQAVTELGEVVRLERKEFYIMNKKSDKFVSRFFT